LEDAGDLSGSVAEPLFARDTAAHPLQSTAVTALRAEVLLALAVKTVPTAATGG
jgi:hypothetical protein